MAAQSRRPSSSRALRHGRAFTLIELLVVLSVITILAALLLPAVVHAMKTAASTNCKSNLDQIHVTMMAYAQTHDSFIPPLNTASPHLDWDPPRKWWQLLEPYAQDLGIFKCPAKKRTKIGYSQNHRVFCAPRSNQSHLNLYVAPQQLTTVRNAAGSLIFCDTGWVTNIHDHPNNWNEDNRNPGCCRFPIDMNHGAHDGKKLYVWWETSPTRPVPRHPAYTTNCVFFDGHADGIPTWDLADDDYGDPNCLYDNQ